MFQESRGGGREGKSGTRMSRVSLATKLMNVRSFSSRHEGIVAKSFLYSL